MNGSDPLKQYKERRDLETSDEPLGEVSAGGDAPIFVVQKHAASSLHYDLRLESGGVLKSWAVPKGPSMDPAVKRLAVPTEDHPMAYAGFEGVIPEGNYGAGTVIVWDRGTFANLKEDKGFAASLDDGHATFRLDGVKLRGGFALLRTGEGGKPGWLFFKMKDGEARPGSDIAGERPGSVLTGRSLEQVEAEEEPSDLPDFG
ncbi:DNA ligase [Candidatus Bathyarchaeota archaeon RBG_16_57_9]|jgi:DNA ligase D-like protein (predicted 3'-phosphoesterase)|nr:MAG: DNA ligase [Candidatus Bathyarchaeota archaeon RBG_16_57_9]